MLVSTANSVPLSRGAVALAVFLRENDRTASWLARRLTVSRTAVGTWLVGRSRPTNAARVLLAQVCGISVESWEQQEALGVAVTAKVAPGEEVTP